MRGCTARASACSRLSATRPLAGVEIGGGAKGRFRTGGSLRVGPQVRIRLAPAANPLRTLPGTALVLGESLANTSRWVTTGPLDLLSLSDGNHPVRYLFL